MASRPEFITFVSAEAMAGRLADLVAISLERGIAARGRASIALSGGSTPAALYAALSHKSLDWTKVAATLVDERSVAPSADGSNEAFVRRSLLRNRATKARFVGLWDETAESAAVAAVATARISVIIRPFDVVILGMGADGHAASWFPGADGLGAALDEKAPDIVAVRAKKSVITGEHIDRLTLSLRAIRDARVIILLISGNEKRRVFERACGEGGVDEMPVRAIIRARPDMWVCWAP